VKDNFVGLGESVWDALTHLPDVGRDVRDPNFWRHFGNLVVDDAQDLWAKAKSIWDNPGAAWNTLLDKLPDIAGDMITALLMRGAGKWFKDKFCFVAGTLVGTEAGLRPIEAVRKGERVWAYDFGAGTWRLCVVEETLRRHYTGDLVTLAVSGEEITSTGDHPFWVIEGEGLAERPEPLHVPALEPGNIGTPGRWVDARQVKSGDVFLAREGKPQLVQKVSVRDAAVWVYNLEVGSLNNFVVGTGQWLAHNRNLLRERMLQQNPPPKWMKNPQAHHDLPQTFRKKFKKAGLDIDDPAYGRWVEGSPQGTHQSWSPEFKQKWRDFFRNNPKASKEDILDFMKKLRKNPRFQ
jgi:hypothetical protein